MFMGAMMVGPLGGWAIKRFDKAMEGRVKSGFEMPGGTTSPPASSACCSPFSPSSSSVPRQGCSGAAGERCRLPGGQPPLPSPPSSSSRPRSVPEQRHQPRHLRRSGIQQATEQAARHFLIRSGTRVRAWGVLLATWCSAVAPPKQSAAGASIIHLLRRHPRNLRPYVLMNPRLILAVIAGGKDRGLHPDPVQRRSGLPRLPGSIFAVLLMTPKASLIGVLLSIVASATVSFLVAAVFVRAQQPEADEADALGEATRKMKAMKGAARDHRRQKPETELTAVRNIVVACDGGMGSSAMAPACCASGCRPPVSTSA